MRLATLLCLIFVFSDGHLLAQRNLEVDDFFSIKSVRDPQISPDGKWVAYTVSETDLEKDKRETRVWMIPSEGGDAIPMTMKGFSSSRPRWSPDNKYLAFSGSRMESKSQVWLLNRLGGEAQQLTEVKHGISSYVWSSDGTKLALTIKDKKEEEEDEKKKKPKPWVIDRLEIKRDYTGYLDSLSTHLYVFDLASKTLKQLTDGSYSIGNPAWSPDGSSIAFDANITDYPDSNRNSDIWTVASDTTGSPHIPVQITTNPGSDSNPVWSPDGKQIAYHTGTEPDKIWYALDYIAITDIEDKTTQVLTQHLDRNVSQPIWSSDGKKITVTIEDSGERHIGEIDVATREFSKTVEGHHRASSHRKVGGQTALLLSKSQLPTEVFIKDSNGLRQLTHTNTVLLDSLSLSSVRNINYESEPGVMVEGFIFSPPNVEDGKKYPVILRIHGGPVSQYDFSFNFEAQLLAAQGYVVVTTNPRGSSGYGQAFSEALWAQWGVPDTKDVLAGVDYVIEEGIGDPDKLGVGGWSYGGMLTNYIITSTDRFKVAISGASEANYRANYGHDHYQYFWEKELGLPWENSEAWEKISPFNNVGNIKTPTLWIGGEKDWNVPIMNSEQMYQATKRLGIDTQLVVYPGEGHGIRKPSFQKDRYERYITWYAKYLKN